MDATAAEAARTTLENRGVRTRRAFDRWGILAAEINPDSAGVLRAHGNVLFLEPVESVIEQVPAATARLHTGAVAAGQTVPTNITQVRAPNANLITTGDGVDVVIMDSGIDKANDDCGPNFLHEDIDNSASEENLIWFEVQGGISQGHCRDVSGHGTTVAGVLLATNNMVGVRGVAPFVTRHHNFKVLDPTFPGGPTEGDFEEIAFALELVPDDAVVNMSLGGPFSTAVAMAVADLYDNHDVVLVAAAGNDPSGGGTSTVAFPATDSHVIAVSGVTADDERAVNVTGTGLPLCEGSGFGSSFGPEVELAAPFVVFSTVLNEQGKYGNACGTSFSAPHVTAVAALVRARWPSWTNAQVRSRLQQTALNLGSPQFFGYGRIDACAAVDCQGRGSISGPATLEIFQTGTWTATNVGGGIGPYSFKWFVNSTQVGTGSSYSASFPTEGNRQLKLQIIPATGIKGTTTKTVSVTCVPVPPQLQCEG